MAARPSIAVVLAGALASLGASYRTQNFLVEAPTAQFAEQVGKWAEHYRREKAIQWLGNEMRPWGQPCPLRVSVTMNGSSGATSFAFDRGAILSIDMHIEGAADRLIASVLPHEITHTVFAYYFRAPMPRWADEGGSVLSEDDQERGRHDQLVRQILSTPGRAIRLRQLFTMTRYPPDVMVLYAEGYSVTNFLVNQGGRGSFLAFINKGMQGNWDAAVREYYHFNSVEELEKAWLHNLPGTRTGAPAGQLASGRSRPEGEAANHVVVRQTVPPAPVLPVLEAPQPVYRGQAPGRDDGYEQRPGSSAFPPPTPAWPAPPPGPPAAPVQLLPPQFEPAPPQAIPHSPAGWSP
jgi:hypothetical protein